MFINLLTYLTKSCCCYWYFRNTNYFKPLYWLNPDFYSKTLSNISLTFCIFLTSTWWKYDDLYDICATRYTGSSLAAYIPFLSPDKCTWQQSYTYLHLQGNILQGNREWTEVRKLKAITKLSFKNVHFLQHVFSLIISSRMATQSLIPQLIWEKTFACISVFSRIL